MARLASLAGRGLGMKRRGFSALGLYACIYLVFLYAPVLMLPLFSLNDATYVAFPLHGFTWRWYQELLADSDLHAAALNSLKVAVVASLAATSAGTLTAYALTRGRGVGTRTVAALSVVPLFVPGVILGIALLIVANLIGIGPSLIAVTFGHIIVCLPLSIVIMRGRFAAYSRAVEEAAMDLGAPPWATFRRISLPIAAPGVISCLILSFTTSIDEFIVSFFLVGTQQTLPLFIWSHLRFPTQLPRMLALGTLILLLSCCLVLCAELIRRRGTDKTAFA
jgi:spermidine/putrescine transport system permease protein